MEKNSSLFWKYVGGLLLFGFAIESLFVFCNYYKHGFAESAAWGGESLTGLAAFLILTGFLYERYQKRTEAALEEVFFYLDRVTPIFVKYTEQIITLYPDKSFEDLIKIRPAIEKIEDFNFSWITVNKLTEKAKIQSDFQSDIKHRAIMNNVRLLLDNMEYLAIHIKERTTVNEPSLKSIQQGFVMVVEENFVTILSSMLTNEGTYSNVRWLYQNWYKSIGRQTEEQKRQAIQNALRKGLIKATASNS